MLVSVIIPVYNDAAWLERAVSSVLEQEIDGLEIVLIDNNSTDTSPELCRQLQLRHPEIIVLGHATRQGPAAARNKGLYLASGEWVNFLDADDIFLPGKIARQLALADGDTDWVVQAYYDQAINGERRISELNTDPWKGLVYNGGIGCTNSQIIKRKLLLEIEGQSELLFFGEDADMYFRLLKMGPNIKMDTTPGSVYIDRSGPRLSIFSHTLALRGVVFLKASVIDWLKENNSEYYSNNDAFFRAALLGTIRQLATDNIDEAEELFNVFFPEGIEDGKIDFSISSWLVKVYPVLGFSNVEHLRLLVSRYLLSPFRKRGAEMLVLM